MATPDLREVEVQGQPRGRLEARPLTFWAGGGACLGGAKAASLCGGAFAGTYLLPGSASGALYQMRARTILAPEVGALGQLSQPIASGLVLAASVRAGIPLLRTGVLVEGTSAQLTTPLLDAQVGLRLGWAISF